MIECTIVGLSEKEIVDGVSEYVYNICKMESFAREDILAANHDSLIDDVYRAVGVLKESYILEEAEMIKLLSLVKFGDALGFLKIKDHKAFDNLIVEASKANLMEMGIFSQNMQEERVRSKYISKKINELVDKLD